jgi:beta-lactamase class A
VHRGLGLAVAVALLVSCSSRGSKSDTSKSTSSSTTSTTLATLRAGPLADRARDALEYVNAGTGVVSDLFAPSFLAQISEQQLQQIVGTQLHPAGPFTLGGAKAQTANAAEIVVRSSPEWTMSIVIEPDPPHRITGLVLRPSPAVVSTWGEYDRTLEAAAPTVAVLAAEVVDGRCSVVHALHADRSQPLGSAFKLYVLGALAKAIQRGDVHWDDEIELRDEGRVQSSPKLGSVPAGTKVKLQDLAADMISVSDNTATDLVLLHVGRTVVESSLAELGLRDPDRNMPFLTTRELTLLKFGIPAADRDAYAAAGTSKRRELLDALPKHGATLDQLTGSLATPTLIDELEWFASPQDLCRVHVALQDLARDDGLDPVRSILSINPGEPLDDEWTYVAYKGGSEPGVLTGTWLAERKDGRRFVVAALLENPKGTIDVDAVAAMSAAFSLLAKE